MPRYLFHLFNSDTTVDEEGRELPNDAAALQVAAESARAMAAESVLRGHLILDHHINVENDAGETIATVHFRDVVRVHEHSDSSTRH